MRQRIAIAVAVLAVGLLTGLAGLFARAQNPSMTVAGGGSRESTQSSAPPELSAAEAPSGAVTRTPPASSGAEPGSALTQTPDSVRGRMVFDSLGCARCHSVAGAGSPRYPLDGVGARRNAAQLRAWTQGAEVLADSLPPSAWRTKQAFNALKPADLNALVAYLLSLKGR